MNKNIDYSNRDLECLLKVIQDHWRSRENTQFNKNCI